MSGQCQAPKCLLKDYDQCKNSQESNSACAIAGISASERRSDSSAQCTTINGGVNYTRIQSECDIGVDQKSCGNITGCKWGYTLLNTDSPLSKGCMLYEGNQSCGIPNNNR